MQEERAVQLNKSIINKCAAQTREKCATFFCFQESDEEDLFDDLVVAGQITESYQAKCGKCVICVTSQGAQSSFRKVDDCAAVQ